MPEPSIGRIVHYVLGEGRSEGESRPAQIVAVFPQPEAPAVLNLVVTLDGENDHIPTSPHAHDFPHRHEGSEADATSVRTEQPALEPSALHVWQTSVPHAEAVGTPPTYVPGTWHWPPGVS